MTDILDADTAAAETVSKPQSSWRDHLKVHPAADLFPRMSEDELRELGEDIKANGLRSPIVLTDDMLLDGRNRLDAMELVGVKFELRGTDERHRGRPVKDGVCVLYIEGGRAPETGNGIYRGILNKTFDEPEGAYDYAISANLHRRHLTGEDKRDLIAKVLKAKPEASNRQIAKQVKAHHTTVGTVRAELESTGEISQLDKTTGADGKKRKKPAKKRAVEPDQERRDREERVALYQKVLDEERAAEQRATGSAEISADERREYYAATENPTIVDGQAVEILPPEPKDGNPIWNAWCKAKPKHRREFVTLGWDDIEQERKRAVKHREGQS
jgi:transposase